MRITANPVELLRYPFEWWRSARYVREVAAREKVSIVHVHHPVGALYASLTTRALRIPMILHVHDGLPARPLYVLRCAKP
jgi:UDP-N-acetylglucosamine:LPS N-acetylglucosamine transferase